MERDRQRYRPVEIDTVELGPRAADALAVDTGGQSAVSAGPSSTSGSSEGRR